jgi:hypothetical protein
VYETVSAFEDTWVECLGDLGRYRMGIEDQGDYDREVWASVSGSWFEGCRQDASRGSPISPPGDLSRTEYPRPTALLL